MRYDTVLFDADGTLLDFLRSEAEALADALREIGTEPKREMIQTYSKINDGLWKQLERGEIERAVLAYRRFELLFERYGISFDAKRMAELYMTRLSTKGYCIKGAATLCRSLKERARLYIVTNGTEWIQRGRWAVSGLEEYFSEVFISEQIGYQKPDPRFFEAVAGEIPDFDREKTLIVGDSLTSDMQGGINFGLDTCWYNPDGKTASAELAGQLTYVVRSLEEIETIVTEGATV